jgi:hypothetical protein
MKRTNIVTRLRNQISLSAKTALLAETKKLLDEIEVLRAERDEARREVCQLKSWNFSRSIDAPDYALLRKWDCFKDHI